MNDPSALLAPPLDPALVDALEPLFRQILRLDAAMPTKASFFSMGGTSLQAVALAACVQSRFDVEVTALTVVDHPTLEAMARHIGELRAGLEDSEEGVL